MDDTHIAFGFHLGSWDGPRKIESSAAISAALEADEPAWLHLDADHADTPDWIDAHLGYLDPSIRAALTEPETRPRAVQIGDGLLVFLRGINFADEADPEDMVSLRLWLDPARIVSLSRRRLRSVDAVADRISSATGGAERTGALLSQIVDELTGRIETHVTDLDDRAEALEAKVIAEPRGDLGSNISDLRLELIDLRRFLAPQRDAIRDMLTSEVSWLDETDFRALTEQYDQMTRVTETLEAVREQLATVRDELDSARSDRLNRNLYVLSVISAVFLPLSFLTGLMGINLAGMPGATWPPAFYVFTGLLVLAGAAVLFALRWMKLL